MRFEASQHMKLGQHMKLAPRMIQSMEILQMSQLELEERIEQELESNITLEMAEPESPDGQTPERDEATGGDRELDAGDGGGEHDFERLEQYGEMNPDAVENLFSSDRNHPSESFEGGGIPSSRLAGERDAKSEAMANTEARSASVQEQLLDQWRLTDVREELRPLGAQIIGYIEDDGYLRTPLEDVRDRAPEPLRQVEMETWERALSAVQLLLEPTGVGARTPRECLLLQLDVLEEELPDYADSASNGHAESPGGWEKVRVLVEDHLDDMAQNRLPKIAERTGMTLDEIKGAMERMRLLSLAPGRRLVSETASVIVPDAFVEYDAEQDRYIAYLNDRRLPNLRVNQEYARMSRDRGVEKPTRDFIKKNLSNASWLLDAVEQRRRTLLRVIKVVVDAQRDFFDHGPAFLRPLPMTQVAEQLGVHVATVSRAVADKHLATPRGTVALRGFFSGGTQTQTGEDVSWDAIKAALREVVDAEDKKKPLSDDALAKALEARGIEIARRTVAKYRDQLNIPTARLRKAY